MFRKIRIAAISALLGLGTLAGAPATAQADGIYFSFGSGGSQAGVVIGHRDRWDPPRRGYHDRWNPPHRGGYRARACTPGYAVHKARRMGLRHAHVTRANRNIIRVSGVKHRHHAHIIFARAPHCPVIRMR